MPTRYLSESETSFIQVLKMNRKTIEKANINQRLDILVLGNVPNYIDTFFHKKV